MAVAGGGLLGWGATEEAKFSNATYPLENFSNENQRASVIEADARRINQLYMLGYGLIGVGVATTSVGVFVMPVSASFLIKRPINGVSGEFFCMKKDTYKTGK